MIVNFLGRSQHFRRLKLPFFLDPVKAGFPSPAQDHIERTLDLNELCVKHPSATYFVRADGESMVGVGIFPNDVLVVDRSLEPRNNDVVIASVDGAFTVKLLRKGHRVQLVAANPDYSPIEFDTESELEIFGVVTNVRHKLRND